MSGKIIPVKTGHYRAWWEKDSVEDDKLIEYNDDEKEKFIDENNLLPRKHITDYSTLNETKPVKQQSYQTEAKHNLGNLSSYITCDECPLKELKSGKHAAQKSPKHEDSVKCQANPGRFKKKFQVRKNNSQPKYSNKYNKDSDNYAFHQNQYAKDVKYSKEHTRVTNKGKKQSMKYRAEISGDRYQEIIKILYGVEINLESIDKETLVVHCQSRKSVVRISSSFSEKSFTSISNGKRSRSKKKEKKSHCNISKCKIISNLSNTARKKDLKSNQQQLLKSQPCENVMDGLDFLQRDSMHLLASLTNHAKLRVNEVTNYIQCPSYVLHASDAARSSSDKEYEDSSSSTPVFEHTPTKPVIKKERRSIMYRSKYLQKIISQSKQLHTESVSCDKTLTKTINCPQVGGLDEELSTECSSPNHYQNSISLKEVGTNTSPSLECKNDTLLGKSASIKSISALTPNKSIISCDGSRCETSRGTFQQQQFGNTTKFKDSNSPNMNIYVSSCTEPEIDLLSRPATGGSSTRKTCLSTEKCKRKMEENTLNQIGSNSSCSHISETHRIERKNSSKSYPIFNMDDSADSNVCNSLNILKRGKSYIEGLIPSDTPRNIPTDQIKEKPSDDVCKDSGRRTLFDAVEFIEKDSIGIGAKEKLASFNSGHAMSDMLYDTSFVIHAENKDIAICDRSLKGEQRKNAGKPLEHQIDNNTYEFKDVAKEKLVNFNLGNEMSDTLYGTTYMKENMSKRNVRIQRSKSKSPKENNSTYTKDTEVKKKEDADTAISSTICEEMLTFKPSFENNGKINQQKYFLTDASNAVVAKNQNILTPLEKTYYANISTVDHSKEEMVSPGYYLSTSSTPLTSDVNYMNNIISNSLQMGNNIFQNPMPYVCYPVTIGIINSSGVHPNLCNNMNMTHFLTKNAITPQAPPVTIKESVEVENCNPHNTEELISRSLAENIISSEIEKNTRSGNNKVDCAENTNAVEISDSNTSKLDKSFTLQTPKDTLGWESNKAISGQSYPAQLAKIIGCESLSGQNVASILYGGYEEPERHEKFNAKYISVNHDSYKGIQNRLQVSEPSSFQTSKDKIAERNIFRRKPKGIVPGLEDITD